MDKKDILNLIHKKGLDYRPDNLSIFQKLPYPSSVVLDKKEGRYGVYITEPRNEIRSPYWKGDKVPPNPGSTIHEVINGEDKIVARREIDLNTKKGYWRDLR